MSPPTPKTTEHDVGAAEAIMALNFANWSPVKKESLKQHPSPSPSKEDKDEDKNNEANDSMGANNDDMEAIKNYIKRTDQ